MPEARPVEPFLSVFTPTHKPGNLHRPWKSLRMQGSSWEWVIGLNGGAALLDSPLRDDARVRVVDLGDEPAGNIGALKRALCSQCRGKYLVELDHDDELLPGALARLHDVAIEDDYPEFIYSDVLRIHAQHQTNQLFSEYYGWAPPYTIEHDGRQYAVQPSFPATAASLHDIHFAPDHVRVWRRDFYERIGGHDASLPVCDDHDLLVRTYITGGRMARVPAPLYLYWLHEDGSNTYLERNAEIQQRQREIGDKYRDQLIREWCRREGLLRVELGGGRTCADHGLIGLSLREADIVHDVIDRGLPFPDNSVGEIRAQDFLEHIPHCRDSRCRHVAGQCVVGLMNEIWRVLAPEGWFISSTPSTAGRGAFQDPTHCSFWNPNSFWYYTRAAQARFVPGLKARFTAKRIREHFPADWHRQHDIPYVDAVLIALKRPYQPGENGFWTPPV